MQQDNKCQRILSSTFAVKNRTSYQVSGVGSNVIQRKPVVTRSEVVAISIATRRPKIQCQTSR